LTEKNKEKNLLRHILIQVFPVKIVITTLYNDEISLNIRLEQLKKKYIIAIGSIALNFLLQEEKKDILDLSRSIIIT